MNWVPTDWAIVVFVALTMLLSAPLPTDMNRGRTDHKP